MKMNGIEDFMTPQCMDIAQPNHGFFGYLLRCKCLSQEDVSGDFIFIDDGTDCFVRFPSVKSHREIIRTDGTPAPAVTMIFPRDALLRQ